MTVFNLTRKTPLILIRKPAMPDLKDYVTTEEVAKQLGFHVIHVRKMVRERKLDGLKAGPIWLVSRKSVADYKKRTEGMSKFDPHRGRQ